MNYTPDIFDVSQLHITFSELFTKKETLEYKLQQYQKAFDAFKSMNFPELLIYERKKEYNKNIIPDKSVLMQIKANESDLAVKEFRQTINVLNKELKEINTLIKKEEFKLQNMFQFKEINLNRYLKTLDMYYNDSFLFTDLFEDIFNNEFNDKQLYTEINLQRNYSIFNLLILRAPNEWKWLFRNIIDEQIYLNQQ